MYYTCPPLLPAPPPLLELFDYFICLPFPPKAWELFLHLLTLVTYPGGNCGGGPICAISSEKSSRYEMDIIFSKNQFSTFVFVDSSQTNAVGWLVHCQSVDRIGS